MALGPNRIGQISPNILFPPTLCLVVRVNYIDIYSNLFDNAIET